ncbi:ParB N-terminal domain-containing protein [Pararhodobacter sp. SW119]|uniref:ParB/RepB/Spo0J family partition protein n=1 Tax=Pararhodobacter sp. SW119 TaxID=2780075 RepID=UPI001ADEF378|nr:ParB N-terminal domain-containing protein [Pararhodobacter sp. SW119]
MAKRRRLTAAPLLAGSPPAEAAAPIPLRRPPIAEVAGEAAATSALADMAQRFERARTEGRMIQSLPLDAIETDWLVRDRLRIEDEGQAALIASIRARGQQVPVEVVDLGDGRYGLISGWRRIAALRSLHEETDEARFDAALAILRRPADAPEAYLAMVEENEIRAGLSYYERARIVARAVEAGVFPGDTAALQALFAAASRPRRSKIGSFLRIVRELDAALRFPAAIPERLGLRLSAALAEDPDLGARITGELGQNPPESAEAELARLSRLAAPAPRTPPGQTRKPAGSATEPSAQTPIVTYEPERGRITLTGSGIDAALARRLRTWLSDGQG